MSGKVTGRLIWGKKLSHVINRIINTFSKKSKRKPAIANLAKM